MEDKQKRALLKTVLFAVGLAALSFFLIMWPFQAAIAFVWLSLGGAGIAICFMAYMLFLSFEEENEAKKRYEKETHL